MKPFRFALQPLRAVREHKEQTVRERYAHTLRAREEAAALVQAASAELSAGWKRLNEQMASGASGEELLRSRAWCNVLEVRVKERTAALEEAHRAVDAVLKDLMLATRERQTLEHFFDQRRRAYDREVQREEQKLLDETAIQLVHSPTPLRPVNPAAAM